jgi:hypothetical protein
MRKSVKHAWAFFALFAGLSFLGSSLVKLSAQDVQQTQGSKKPELPTLDYETELQAMEATANVGSKKIRARFNSRSEILRNERRISELPQLAGPIPTNDHLFVGMAALPVTQSDVIVAGKVVDAQAHLSDDRTDVYSEYSVEVSDIFKNTGNAVSGTISTTRMGGAVRFASGKVQEYKRVGHGVPVRGNLYVLFLKREEEGDFTILTGYELSNGLVTPLDGEGQGLPFDYYKNVAESQFLQDLRSTIQRGGGDK